MSAPGESRRSQADRSADSREKIITAAIDLVGTKGYHRTTLVEIGQRAGLSRGLVTFHFGSKEQCMIEVVGAIRERVTQQLEAGGPHLRGLAAIDDLVEQYFARDRLRRLDAPTYARAMFVLMIESVTASPGLRSAVALNNSVIREMISRWIEEAVVDGDIARPEHEKDLAALIEGLLRGVTLQYLTDDSSVDLGQVTAVAKAMIRGYLTGFAES